MIDRYEYLTLGMLLIGKCGVSGGMRLNIFIKSQMHCARLRMSTSVI
jgi:hypothetical protein